MMIFFINVLKTHYSGFLTKSQVRRNSVVNEKFLCVFPQVYIIDFKLPKGIKAT